MLSFKRNIKRFPAWCLGLITGCFMLGACDHVFIYDDEGDCAVTYKVRFKYDYNMKYADAFAHEVAWVTLYLVDSGGNVAWQKTEQGDALSQEGYVMDVDVSPGKYDLLVWGGTTDKGSFTIPASTKATELGCTLNRSRDAGGNAYVDSDLDRLFHGYLAGQSFPEDAGSYLYTVPLVKDTNVIRVVLQNLSGDEMDKDNFTFTITDDNGTMAWDNSVLADEEITYYAWYTGEGEVGDIVTTAAASLDATASSTLTLHDADTRATESAVVAELTTARLMNGNTTRLVVTNNDTGAVVFSIPLIDYLLLVKGNYNSAMDDQEFLDRQDEYSLIFFLDESGDWMDMYIYINSWKVVLQDAEL